MDALLSIRMKILSSTLAALMAAGTLLAAPEVRQLDKADVLPLALEDRFEFRKVKIQKHDPELELSTPSEMMRFERRRLDFGAITALDRKMRYGQYFTFFWRAGREADITVRLEYRQSNLGPYLLAKEVDYPDAKGSYSTDFEVIGDEYLNDGRVTMWRAVLIENGKIVGLTQSYLWN